MKRILILFTILSLIFCNGINVFATEHIYSYDTVKEAEELINYLELFEYENRREETITRADFAVYAGRILNVDEFSQNSVTYFVDIPLDHWALNSINTLVTMGYISVPQDNNFRPDDAISFEEAVKILVSMLGYDRYAQYNGGYPKGYMKTAQKIEMLDDIEDCTALTYEKAVILFANALNIPIFEEVIFENDYTSFSQSKTETLLSMYQNIYRTEGVVDAINNSSIYSESGVGENRISVDGTLYESAEINLKFLGCDVVAYYFKDEKSSLGQIKFIMLNYDSKKMIYITDEDFVSFDDSFNLRYYKNDSSPRVTEKTLPRNACYIYNGVAITDNIVEKMNITNGSIKILQTETVGGYTVIIEQASVMVATHVDAENKRVYCNGGEENYLDFSGSKIDCVIFNKNHSKIDFSAIKAEDVLTVFEVPGKSMYVYLNDTVVSGTLEKIKVDETSKYFVINGIEYKVNSTFYDSLIREISVGDTATFKFDLYGEIAFLKITNKNDEFLYGYYCGMAKTDGIDKTVRIRLFNQNGEIVVYDIADRVKIDGGAHNGAEEISSALNVSLNEAQVIYSTLSGSNAYKNRLIRYKLNTENKISEIDTPYLSEKENDASLSYVSAEKSCDYVQTTTNYGLFGSTMPFNNSTLLFKVPTETALEAGEYDRFAVTELPSTLKYPSNIDAIGYRASSEGGFCDVIVAVTADMYGVLADDNLMVDEIYKSLNSDGEVVECIKGYTGGVEYTYYVSEDVTNSAGESVPLGDSGIERGDIVVLSFDNNGNVIRYCLFYDADAGVYDITGTGAVVTADSYNTANFKNAYTAKRRFTVGYVKENYGGLLGISYDKGAAVAERYYAVPITVTVYDSTCERKQIYKGTIADVVDYESAGNDCSRIVVYAVSSMWRTYYIYK